jgi:hypothetical protein
MDDLKPSAEFEKKLEAAASAPLADPKFVSDLRAQMLAASAANQVSKPENTSFSLAAWMKTFWSSSTNLSTSQGNTLMRKRLMVPALMAALVLTIAAVFAFNTATSVSAQQIIERATSAQAAGLSSQGIWHSVVEIYENPQALPGDRPGTKTISESYEDMGPGSDRSAPAVMTGLYRYITTDATGKILDASSTDGSTLYSSYPNGPAVTAPNGELVIYRSPVQPDNRKQGGSFDPIANAKSLFDDFRDNPRVELEGKITWRDGSQAYVLVDHNVQTQKQADGKVQQTPLGTTKMIFNAKTYELLEDQTSIIKDGQDIVISEAIFSVSEVLPAGSKVAWDLSDLKNVSFVDDSAAPDPNQVPVTKTITEHELAGLINAYVLKTIPEGLTLKILSTPNGDSFNYEINYYNAAGDCPFGLMAVGKMDPGFIEKNFYDGSYRTASGLVINYSPSSRKDSTSGMLTIPDGTSFLLGASMSREETQKLAEELVPAK